ncbi:MAG TPA: sulfite exporter TauE/SafE family protein [Parachlamydiaceae bacterium]|nr:sulfite exporter TauE/SafE family protein [Parachlamydiaceae bacterium]
MTSIILIGSILAGLLGALSGLGGGIVIVPLLVLGLGVDIHYAIGSSLIAVIATSTAASCAYVKEGYTNVRIGILLETATTVGAVTGVSIASQLPASILSGIFGFFLLYCAASSLYQARKIPKEFTSDKLALALNLESTYPTDQGIKSYPVHQVPLGYAIMFLAGGLSSVLGIGSGALKVVALDRVMGLPFKVSTTTSNFMIGVTAAASAGLYLKLGYIDPILTMPIVLGVTGGSLVGARLLPHMSTDVLRKLFAYVVIVIGMQMIWQIFSKGIG